ncbi:MAG: hypothetical protein M1815_004958 [Lichina confinis]|nr:MAG: hypothetical protein M1815_004958 [Lichina confinis]
MCTIRHLERRRRSNVTSVRRRTALQAYYSRARQFEVVGREQCRLHVSTSVPYGESDQAPASTIGPEIRHPEKAMLLETEPACQACLEEAGPSAMEKEQSAWSGPFESANRSLGC